MPFNSKRNSRDDNSKKRRSNSENFGSKGGHKHNRTDRDYEDKRGSSYNKEDKSPFDKFMKKDGKPSERGDRRSTDRFGSRDGRRSGDSDTRKSFGRDNRRSADQYGDRKSRKPFGAEEKRSDRYGSDRDRSKSFGRNDRKGAGKSYDRGSKPTYGRGRAEQPEHENEFKFSGHRKFSPAKSPAKRDAQDDGLIRLNRYISNAGVCSRRKADELIQAGVVSVNGVVVTELGTKVDPAKDEVRYNNERLKREKMVYVLLNKPKDYITTTDDPQERKTVMQLVANATKERIYPVGRLDRNTTGLLLLTNDGNLAEKLSHPRNNISKLYHVELDKNLTQGDFNKIEFGLTLEDGVIKPDALSYIQGGSKRELGIQIHSGKNRIVRRIFESLGYEVVKLDRVVYANLTKKDLPRGRWRYLEERELIQLKHFIK